MKQKFKELAIQAQEQVGDGLKDPSRLQSWFMDELVQEKFAELIVRECVGVVDWIPDSHGNCIDNFGKAIKKHFDIKEEDEHIKKN